ncbi:hypothetical protein [Gracilibacillus sp. YIM 98692]|uniref:hypothetical protein n=1 Tax=Gracilibacillus sp. YIM 98692 TaxID=2663532 RepID=UPI0013CF4820|nr:hypothetical protein [Gracilibacillus sp. YIM 98692]
MLWFIILIAILVYILYSLHTIKRRQELIMKKLEIEEQEEVNSPFERIDQE